MSVSSPNSPGSPATSELAKCRSPRLTRQMPNLILMPDPIILDYVYTSVGLVGVRAVIGELLSTDHGAGVSTLHSPLAACRRSTPAY